jgi:signal peptidase I
MRCADGPVLDDQGEWMQAEEQPKSRTRSALREFVETILFTLLIYILIRTFLFENYRVVGRSMEATLEDGQYLVVYKLGYRLHDPQRGDIIVFHDPRNGERKLIKRVIGLPGETLEIKEGYVFINGQEIDEPYIQAPGRSSRAPTLIPENDYFVMGDNRTNSSDSRSWGPLPKEKIVGKAWLTYWPPSRWGIAAHENYENLP